MNLQRFAFGILSVCLLFISNPAHAGDSLTDKLGVDRGIVAVVGLGEGGVDEVIALAEQDGRIVYFQSSDHEQLMKVRRAADRAQLLGVRIFAEESPSDRIHLGTNVADSIVVHGDAVTAMRESELLRAVRPRGVAWSGTKRIVKPVPAGMDDWSHPYHGPDNNPQSQDQHVRGDLRTQFLGFPKFSPMPEQTVIAGGRIFKAMGHIAHKANQNAMLNTLLCINAYNGTILWKRDLPVGFMIHRNTMVATDDVLYMGDHQSCKLFDAATGKLVDEILVDGEISDGSVWKWMAIRDNTLYALVGNPEIQVDTQKSARRGLGHWPWGMWEGHDYSDPRTAFGYGRTLVAIDLKTRKRLWHYRDEEFLDARAVCMNSDRIYCCSPERFLSCIDADSGELLWKSTDKSLLEAIGPNAKAQHFITGYATTCYIKCTEDYILFAGPQRTKLVAASAADGTYKWSYPVGNLQLVLRDDAIWAAGPQKSESGLKFDYETGKVLDKFPARRACTRATGCIDSVFFRAHGGTVRVLTASNQAQHIDPMRPPCQDGVLVSNGHLYWGPWMCGCELSLYGNICLRPSKDSRAALVAEPQLKETTADLNVAPLRIRVGDWPSYRGSNDRANTTETDLSSPVSLKWTYQICSKVLPTAPVTAGGVTFVADRSGTIHAIDVDGKLAWKQHVGGPVYYPPAVANDRVYVGAGDGRVYAFEAVSGRSLWSYRVATNSEFIPVYGKLVSSHPVAGGVAVRGDTVYAAAGLTHYDGTHIVALDATTGELKSSNDSSGTLEPSVNNGISLQGNIKIVGNELQFLAGGVYEVARYDLKTLKCLNKPAVQVTSQYRTAFYPYYPDYGKYVSLDYVCDNGCSLTHDASYEGSKFANLGLQPPVPDGTNRPVKEAARWLNRRGKTSPAIWTDKQDRRFTSFVIGKRQLLATGHETKTPAQPFLTAMNIEDGVEIWTHKLPSDAVKGGTAVDHDGRFLIALQDGTLVCYEPDLTE